MLGILGIGMAKFIFICLRVLNSDSFPKALTKAEEKILFEKMRAGSEKAREELIERNLRLVAHIIKKYYTSGGEEEDLISIGTIGLIKAIDSFDISNGTKFATYAGKCVQNEILMYFRIQKKMNAETSLSEAVDVDKDGNELTIMDIISTEDNIVDMIDLKNKTKLALKGLENALSKREREIIVLRYGLCGKKVLTQRECSERLGISRSYVSRIEKNALVKLRKYLEKSGESER